MDGLDARLASVETKLELLAKIDDMKSEIADLQQRLARLEAQLRA
jgi:uncharacterized small protein (DUF1192 family)